MIGGRLVVGVCTLVSLLYGCMMGAPNTPSVPLTHTPDDTASSSRLFDSSSLPPITPVTEAEAPACPRAPRSRLIVNERGRVTNNDQALNIRTVAGTQYARIGRMPPGAVFLVLDGPRCAEDYAWFYIVYEDMEGWIAEGDSDMMYAEPYLNG